MALNTFPNTPTLAWSVIKSPNWGTRMQRAVSGRELRISDYVNPVYTFTLTYEVLRDRWDIRDGAGRGGAYPLGFPVRDELRQIWNFFNQQRGAQIPFQFYDPTDNTTRAVAGVPQTIVIGTGDGVTENYQIVSALRAPVIPTVINSISPNTHETINYDTGVVSWPGYAPGVGVNITIDMTYNYKVRFATDNLEAENFMYQLWSLKQLKLTSVLA